MRRVPWGVAALLLAAGVGWFARELVGFRAERPAVSVSAATLLGLVCVPGLFVLFRRGRRFGCGERRETTGGDGSSQLG